MASGTPEAVPPLAVRYEFGGSEEFVLYERMHFVARLFSRQKPVDPAVALHKGTLCPCSCSEREACRGGKDCPLYRAAVAEFGAGIVLPAVTDSGALPSPESVGRLHGMATPFDSSEQG